MSFEEKLRRVLPEELEPVAEELGVSVRTIRSWMRGERTTDPATVFRLETLLGCRPGELSRELGYLPVPTSEIVTGQLASIRSRVVAEAQPVDDELAAVAPDIDVGGLLTGIDVDRAAEAGLRSEILRLVVEDIEAQIGPSTDDERASAAEAYRAAVAAAARW